MNSASAHLLAGALEPRERPQPAETLPASPSTAWPVAILGVPFDPVTLPGAIARIEGMIASRRPHYVVTANVDFLMQAHRDVELRRILLEADLTLCDGTPLVWASRWLGNALPERVAGSDLAPQLMETAAQKGYRVFFLGAAPGVAEAATASLRQRYPNINIVGHYAPPFAALLEMDHAQIVQNVRAAKPDILLVGFGCPKQEKWIAMHHRALGVPVAIGVGATIDFLAGRVKRAPEWMRRSGTEWAFRLVQEPRRLFKRYAHDLTFFFPILAAQWWHLASPHSGSASGRVFALGRPDWDGVDAGASLTRAAFQREAAFWRDLPRRNSHCVVDLSQVRHIDGTGVAFLVQWRKELLGRGRHFVLLAPNETVRRILASLRLTDHFLIVNDAIEAAQRAELLATQAPVQHGGSLRSIAWCGEIIAANVEDVWRTTTDHVRAFVAGGTTLVVIDLARLRFIDSSGAALMLRLTKWAQEQPAQVLFTHAQENVRNVLRLTRLDQLLLEGGQ